VEEKMKWIFRFLVLLLLSNLASANDLELFGGRSITGSVSFLVTIDRPGATLDITAICNINPFWSVSWNQQAMFGTRDNPFRISDLPSGALTVVVNLGRGIACNEFWLSSPNAVVSRGNVQGNVLFIQGN
jgi:hypothetical protein